MVGRGWLSIVKVRGGVSYLWFGVPGRDSLPLVRVWLLLGPCVRCGSWFPDLL